MNENGLSFQICSTVEGFKSAEDGYRAVLEGLGRNITSKTGNAELGRTVQIFIRDRESRVVGGVIGNVFGGWLYVSLLWVEESLRDKGNGTKLLKNDRKRSSEAWMQIRPPRHLQLRSKTILRKTRLHTVCDA